MKKILALILSVLIIFPIGAGAADTEHKIYVREETENLVYQLQQLGVFTVSDGIFFGDTAKVKRCEAAKMLVDLMGGSIGGGEVVFTDVPEYYDYFKEISSVSALGIMNGSGNGLFEPEKEITRVQFIKCMVEVLGYGWKANLKGGYPYGYLVIGEELDLLDGIEGETNAALEKADAVRIIYNSLDVPVYSMAGISNDSVIFEQDKEVTLLEKYHDIYKENGVVQTNDIVSLNSAYAPSTKWVYINDERVIIENNDIFGYVGYSVDYYCRETAEGEDHTLLAFFASEENDADRITNDNLGSADMTELTYFDAKNKKQTVKIGASAKLFCNGELVTTDIQGCLKDFEGEILSVDNDEDGKSDYIFITNWSRYNKIASTDTELMKIQTSDGVIRLDDAENIRIMSSDGSIGTINDISSGDIVAIAESENGKCIIIKSLNTASMTVKTLSGNKFTTDEGEEFNISARLTANQRGDIKIGSTIGAAVDGNTVVWIGEASETFPIGYLIYYKSASTGFGRYKSRARILDTNGKVTIYDLGEKININGKNMDNGQGAALLAQIKADSGLAGDSATSQVVRYQINSDNQLTHLKTITGTKDDIKGDGFYVSYNHNESGGAYIQDIGYGIGTFANYNAVTNKNPIFRVPKTGQEDSADSFFNVVVYDNKTLEDHTTLDLDGYMEEENQIVPSAVVYYKNASTEINTENMFLVEKTSKVLDGDGYEKIKLDGYYYDSYRTFYADSDVVIPEVEKGDVLFFALDSGDNVLKAEKAYDIGENKILEPYGTVDDDYLVMLYIYNAPSGSMIVKTYTEDLAYGVPGDDKGKMFSFQNSVSTKRGMFSYNETEEAFGIGMPEALTDYIRDKVDYDRILLRISDGGYQMGSIIYQK